MFLVAMMCCKYIGCPHPDMLESPPWNIDWWRLCDWHAFYCWENNIDLDAPTDADKFEYLNRLREEDIKNNEDYE